MNGDSLYTATELRKELGSADTAKTVLDMIKTGLSIQQTFDTQRMNQFIFQKQGEDYVINEFTGLRQEAVANKSNPDLLNQISARFNKIGGNIKTNSPRVRNAYETDKIIIDNLVSSMDVVNDFSDWFYGEYEVNDRGFAEQFVDMTLEEIQPIVADMQKELNTFRTTLMNKGVLNKSTDSLISTEILNQEKMLSFVGATMEPGDKMSNVEAIAWRNTRLGTPGITSPAAEHARLETEINKLLSNQALAQRNVNDTQSIMDMHEAGSFPSISEDRLAEMLQPIKDEEGKTISDDLDPNRFEKLSITDQAKHLNAHWKKELDRITTALKTSQAEFHILDNPDTGNWGPDKGTKFITPFESPADKPEDYRERPKEKTKPAKPGDKDFIGPLQSKTPVKKQKKLKPEDLVNEEDPSFIGPKLDSDNKTEEFDESLYTDASKQTVRGKRNVGKMMKKIMPLMKTIQRGTDGYAMLGKEVSARETSKRKVKMREILESYGYDPETKKFNNPFFTKVFEDDIYTGRWIKDSFIKDGKNKTVDDMYAFFEEVYSD